jgi:hypothetical protein
MKGEFGYFPVPDGGGSPLPEPADDLLREILAALKEISAKLDKVQAINIPLGYYCVDGQVAPLSPDGMKSMGIPPFDSPEYVKAAHGGEC